MNEQQRAELERIRDVLYPATGLEDYDEEIIGRVLKDIKALLAQDAPPKQDVPETNFGNMAEPKIGCVNHDCDKCKAVQETVGDWVWSWLMDWCKRNGIAPATQDGLFAMVKDARSKFESTPPAPQPVPVKCWCHKCNEHNTINGLPFSMTQMILCPECGNKRCPKASDHQLDCTGSNEPNQPGSVYTAPQPVPVKTYHDGKPWPVAPKPWVGLTDEDIEQGHKESWVDKQAFESAVWWAEKKLKEKNHDQ
jgi:hypothetical protein